MRSSRGMLLGATLLVFGTGAACRSTAAVLLDLPEEQSQSEVPARAPATPSASANGFNSFAYGDTITERPPIESFATADSVLAMLPRHASGAVDWEAARKQGVIAPRRALPGSRPAPPAGFAYDYYFGAMVTFFPHSVHTEWLGCQSCHPAIYRAREQEGTSMKAIGEGESCGSCHGKVAFGTNACERCHTTMAFPEGRLSAALDADLVIPRDSTAGMEGDFPPSIFPHWTHRMRYRCVACHLDPFGMEAGSTSISMEAMQKGATCGACHDGTTAFAVLECGRCHRPPSEAVREPAPAESG